jgi:hypothetical protein
VARRVGRLVVAQAGEIVLPVAVRARARPSVVAEGQRRRIGFGGWIDETAQVRLKQAPGADQPQRMAGFEAEPWKSQPAAGGGGNDDFLRACALGQEAERWRAQGWRTGGKELEAEARAQAGVVQQNAEVRRAAAENGFAATRRNRKIHKIAKGVVDADPRHAADQEGETEAEAQGVVDRGQQHHQQREAQCQSEAGGQHENAPLPQYGSARARGR